MVVLQLLFLSRGHGRFMVRTCVQTEAILALDGLVCPCLPPPVTRRVERAPVVPCVEPEVDDRVPVLYVSLSSSSSSSSSVTSSGGSTVTPRLPPYSKWLRLLVGLSLRVWGVSVFPNPISDWWVGWQRQAARHHRLVMPASSQ